MLAAPATIRDLPVEILVLIFKLVYAKSRQPKRIRFFGPPDPETVWKTREDILAPSLFPYAVASVCSRWKSILSAFPVFWTRLVIFADSNPTPLSDVQAFLEWSRDLTLDLTVINRQSNDPESSPEYTHLRAIIDLVKPHFHRCRNITFQVRNASSLPRLGNDFCDPCPFLKTLTLNCVQDDGRALADAPSMGFSCPSLERLTVDGRTFKDIISLDEAWWTERFSCVKWLTVSHFTPLIAGDILSLYLALTVFANMQHLSALCITNVQFAYELGSRPPDSFELDLSSLQLEKINNGALEEMFDVAEINTEFLRIVACSRFAHLPFSSELILDDIAPDIDLITPLSIWRGHSLHMKNCPGLTDSIFEMMATSVDDGEFGVPVMKDIFLTDCTNFSVDALMRMVDVRNRAVESYIDSPEFDEYETPLIRFVSVTGRGPVLSEEDAQSLCGRVEYVTWYTLFGSGKICRLQWYRDVLCESMCPIIENGEIL